MDFNRGGRSPQPTTNNTPGSSGGNTPQADQGSTQTKPSSFSDSSSTSSPDKNSKKSGGGVSKFFNLKFASITLLFSATVLVVALLVFLAVSKPRSEASFVEDDKYQAVFLDGGQVYFGQVTHLNNNYLRLVDIYYLRVDQQVQPTEGEDTPIPQEGDISLVKLGCELHGPQDEMLVNMDKLIFWENLKSEGQVSQAIADFKEENPDGQDCEEVEDAAVPGQADAPPQGAPTDDEEFAPPEEELEEGFEEQFED